MDFLQCEDWHLWNLLLLTYSQMLINCNQNCNSYSSRYQYIEKDAFISIPTMMVESIRLSPDAPLDSGSSGQSGLQPACTTCFHCQIGGKIHPLLKKVGKIWWELSCLNNWHLVEEWGAAEFWRCFKSSKVWCASPPLSRDNIMREQVLSDQCKQRKQALIQCQGEWVRWRRRIIKMVSPVFILFVFVAYSELCFMWLIRVRWKKKKCCLFQELFCMFLMPVCNWIDTSTDKSSGKS